MNDDGARDRTLLQRNIRAVIESRSQFDRRKTSSERVADRVTAFTGSMLSVALHATLLVAWLLVNSGVIPGATPFDPPPFVMLAMAASVEAIFLSTFVLISQNRMQALADRRAELNLQISLLAERETTAILALVDAMAAEHGLAREHPDVAELKREVDPQEVLDHIDRAGR